MAPRRLSVPSLAPEVRSPNYYWNSSLFNEVYLQNDIPTNHPEWAQDESGPFHNFLQQFISLCEETKADTFANEAQTVKDWIIPVMELLGWKNRCAIDNLSYTVMEAGKQKSYRPDLLYVDEPTEKALLDVSEPAKRLRAGRNFVRMIVEAKAWKRLDYISREIDTNTTATQKSEKSDDTRALTPEEQCLKYMTILTKKYGILTDGNRWRLLHSELSEGSNKRYFEFVLGYARQSALKLHADRNNEEWDKFVANLKYFFYFFSRNSYYPYDGRTPFIDDVLEYSKKYAQKIEEDLKSSFIDAMTIICNGYKAFLKKTDLSEEQLDLIRAVSESHLFSILFIKSCEVRHILPLKNPDYLKKSLSEIIDTIEYPRFVPSLPADDEMNCRRLKAAFERSFVYTPDGTELYDRLMNLYDVVQNGSHGLEIVGFKETVFEPEEMAFAKTHKLPNAYMVRLLFSLGYTPSEVESRDYQQIPYNFFTPRQLGSIYESFLEYSLLVAPEDMIYHKKKWNPAKLNSNTVVTKYKKCPKVRRGDLYFAFDERERKETGSYYTPDYIVRYIVAETLHPLVRDKSANEILSLHLADLALGSGHFISATVEYLTRAYREALANETYDDVRESYSESAQKILHSCVFGVDINKRAVKLAKMGLWLATANAQRRLEKLDDQLKVANSLTGEINWKKEFPCAFTNSGLDAVVMNPPYIGEKGNRHKFEPVKGGPLGKFYRGKMDYYYFFVHLTLDLLKDGGRFGLITTNYFTTAMGANVLRADLRQRSNLEQLINLGELRIFDSAQGQHNMVWILERSDAHEDKAVKTIVCHSSGKCDEKKFLKLLNESEGCDHFENSQEDIYDGVENYVRLEGVASTKKGKSQAAPLLDKIAGHRRLGSLFLVNTGIQTGADKVSASHIKKFSRSGFSKGAGIFVLSKGELERLELPRDEKKLLAKPFFKNSDIQQYFTSNDTNEWYLNLDRRFVTLEKCSRELRDHIHKYMVIIEASVDNPPYVHRPRDPEIFLGPKIVVPQRSRGNTFGYNEIPWYASCDVYYITQRENSFDLKILLGLLNAKWCYYWLYHRGKRKGEQLELYQTPLSEIPIPTLTRTQESQIIELVQKIIIHGKDHKLDKKLNSICYSAFNLTEDERIQIEKFWDSKMKNNGPEELDSKDAA